MGGDATVACSVLDELVREGPTAPDPTCEPDPGLGFIELGEGDRPGALVATAEGLWLTGGSDSGAFVSAISFEGEVTELITIADAHVSAMTLVASDTLAVLGTIGHDPEDPTLADVFLRRLTLDGTELWAVRFGNESRIYPAALAEGPDESVYIAGSGDGNFLRKYDAAGNLATSSSLPAAPSLCAT